MEPDLKRWKRRQILFPNGKSVGSIRQRYMDNNTYIIVFFLSSLFQEGTSDIRNKKEDESL